MRDDRERLRDVLEAIERIEKYTLRGQEALANEELLQTWVAHHLMIIGEVAVHYRRTSGRHTRLKYGLWPLGSEMSSCMSILASTWALSGM